MALRSEIVKELIHIDKLARSSQRPHENRNKAAEEVLQGLWFGISYIDICKMEKLEIENRLEEEVR